MAKGSPKPTPFKKILCMGCGLYFTKKELTFVEGIPFCSDCKSASVEFKETLKSERDAILSHQGIQTSPQDKWEKAWSSSDMVSLSPERLERLPHPIPLQGIEATLTMRISSRVLDYLFALLGIFLIDTTVHLTVAAKMLFGGTELDAAVYQYATLFDPAGWEHLWQNPDILKKVVLLIMLVIGVYRIPFYLLFRRTLGEFFTGVMLTDERGRYPSLVARTLKGVVATLADASLIGPFIDSSYYAFTKPPQSASDKVAGLYAVRAEGWQSVTREMLHKVSLTRMGE